MSEDSEVGKREIEAMVLDQALDVLPLITGRTVSEDWDDPTATQIEGSPDHIIGLDGATFGIELTEIREAGDAWDYVAEAYHKARKEGDDQARLRVLDQAGTNLFSQMHDFVGVPVSTPATLLRAKVLGDALIAPSKPPRALSRRLPAANASKNEVAASFSAESPIASPLTPEVVYYPKIIIKEPRNGLHNGVDKQSSLSDLRKALREVNSRLSGRLSEKERAHYDDQEAQIERLIERREQSTKQQKQTRYDNRKAARLKRMGGPIRHHAEEPKRPYAPLKK